MQGMPPLLIDALIGKFAAGFERYLGEGGCDEVLASLNDEEREFWHAARARHDARGLK